MLRPFSYASWDDDEERRTHVLPLVTKRKEPIKRKCPRALCIFLCIFLLLMLAVIATVAVIFVVARPTVPEFEIASADLDNIWLSNESGRIINLSSFLATSDPLQQTTSGSSSNSSRNGDSNGSPGANSSASATPSSDLKIASSSPPAPSIADLLEAFGLPHINLENNSTGGALEQVSQALKTALGLGAAAAGAVSTVQDAAEKTKERLQETVGFKGQRADAQEGGQSQAEEASASAPTPAEASNEQGKLELENKSETVEVVAKVISAAAGREEGAGALTLLLLQDPSNLGVLLSNAQLHLDVNGTLTFATKNGNAVDIEYKGVEVDVVFANQSLAKATIAPFKQPPKSQLNVSAVVTADHVPLTSTMGKALVDSVISNKIALKLFITVKGKINRWIISSPSAQASIACDVQVEPLSRRIIDKKCKLTQLKIHTIFGSF